MGVLEKEVDCVVCEKTQKGKNFNNSRLCRAGWICPKCYPTYKKIEEKLLESLSESFKVIMKHNQEMIDATLDFKLR